MILSAFEKVSTTNGSEVQNHGLNDGMISIVSITAAEIKK